MAKFFGAIGFVVDPKEGTGENEGVVIEQPIVERVYYGDVLQNGRRFENGSDINDNIQISNKISIMADAYAQNHFFAMKYINWMGALWKISNVEVQRPRLILTIGGIYNGPTPRFASCTS